MTRDLLNPKRKLTGCSMPVRRDPFNSYAGIVTDYLANYSANADRELRYYRIQRTLDDAIEHAALAHMPSGKRAIHQRRLKASTLKAAWKALKCVDLSTCRNFHELLCLVDDTVRSIGGIGELYVYDTALRIGAFLRLLPDRVYLHAGVRAGARALGFTGLDYIRCSELPDAFAVLQPRQIEDCLCIYKRELTALDGA